MADLIGKVEGIAGLALIGGLAFGALRFGPEVIKSFREAFDGFKSAFDGFKSVGDAAAGAAQAAGDTLNNLTPDNPLDSARDTINLIMSPGSDPVDIGLSGISSIFDWANLFNPGFGKAGGLITDLLGGFMRNTIDPNLAAAAAAAAAAKQASDAAALEHLNTLKATFDEQLEANKAAAAAAVAKATHDMTEEVSKYLAAGKASAGLTASSYTSGRGGNSSSVTYVAPSGAYSTVQNGQIVSGGSAGSYGQPISAKEAAARAKLGIK